MERAVWPAEPPQRGPAAPVLTVAAAAPQYTSRAAQLYRQALDKEASKMTSLPTG